MLCRVDGGGDHLPILRELEIGRREKKTKEEIKNRGESGTDFNIWRGSPSINWCQAVFVGSQRNVKPFSPLFFAISDADVLHVLFFLRDTQGE